MIINHNLNAANALRNTNFNTEAAGKSMQKLSSGLRINGAADDAAGLAISEKMRGQIRGLDQATKNSQDGISLTQTAEGALNETESILQRMRELAVQSRNDTNVTQDRTALNDEFDALRKEIDRISSQTEFNTQKLLNGTFSANFQVGANTGQTISLTINAMDTVSLSITSGITINSAGTASGAISVLDDAIKSVSTERSKLGALQNRLEHTVNNLSTSSENLTSAESRIRDVDMAKEMMTFSKNNILSQAAQAMLSQANQQPQQVLQLLR
ncbi:flagellin [Clostridium beijerinckii]|uniref:flagellin N-terminal helical domain-containing protein n=1 Tax=Clostridium beijerinckii TaxID=1520 RepID=UPI0022E52F24|nr:flagellin [Clostridium beijerinckii]